ncbi:MAG: hypothetical protein COT59_00735, partial [Candidatus Nealsonbacteria bacterium CG09_land_8_20_14_0_10_42_14]
MELIALSCFSIKEALLLFELHCRSLFDFREFCVKILDMKNILNFLIEVGKLKKMPRTGFVWLGIKNPETIAQHSFRVAMMNWILGEKVRPKLDLEKVIKISLVHDLCEVYAGDMTPYWGLLPKDPQKRTEILKRWIRLPQKIKKKRDQEKFQKEKKSLEKLVKNLELSIKKEIMDCWLE